MSEAGIQATDEQKKIVVEWVEGAHDNYGMAHGHDCIPNPSTEELRRVERLHDQDECEAKKREQVLKREIASHYGDPDNITVMLDHNSVTVERR
jgi:hypothetical protein